MYICINVLAFPPHRTAPSSSSSSSHLMRSKLNLHHSFNGCDDDDGPTIGPHTLFEHLYTNIYLVNKAVCICAFGCLGVLNENPYSCLNCHHPFLYTYCEMRSYVLMLNSDNIRTIQSLSSFGPCAYTHTYTFIHAYHLFDFFFIHTHGMCMCCVLNSPVPYTNGIWM